MGLREVIQEDISRMETRASDRTRLWQLICDAYEEGGSEQVTEALQQELTGLREEMEALRQVLKSKL